SVILGRALVASEPQPAGEGTAEVPSGRTYTNPDVQERVTTTLSEVKEALSFERGWVTIYDPLAATLEILGVFGTQKRDLSPGQHLSLDDSASGWAIRHRKSRCDHNHASTQG